MPRQTPVKKELFASTLKKLFLGVLVGVLGFVVITGVDPGKTTAATADTVNFQAKLMTSAGAIAADGSYNVEFKLYNVSSGGTALWTEDYLNSASHGVRVANGYLTVNLGQYTPFPGTINWAQDLWIGMNVGGTASSASWDGEMTPRLKLTAVPYAFSAGNLSNLSGTIQSTLVFQGGTGGNQIFQLDNQGAAGTYHIATTNNVIQNQWSTTQTNANFKIQGTSGHVTAVIQGASGQDIADFVSSGGATVASIDANGNVLAPGLDTKTVGGTIHIGQTNATGGISLDQATTLNKGSSSALVIKNGTETQLTINTNARTTGVAGNIIKVGDSAGFDTATTILQLDSASAIPTSNLASLNGGLYYNSNSTDGIGIHAISNGADVLLCDSTGSCGTGSIKLQIAYNNSSTGVPEIKLNSTQGAVDIQDADTSLGSTANLFAVRGSNASGYGSQYFVIQGNGNVGIGTTGNPSKLFSVGGSTGYFTVDGSGNIVTPGTSQISGASTLGGGSNTVQLKVRAGAAQGTDLQQFTANNGATVYSGFDSSGNLFLMDTSNGTRQTIEVVPNSINQNQYIKIPQLTRSDTATICTTDGNCIGNGGSGDVFNGGQSGPLVLGTNDATSTALSFVTGGTGTSGTVVSRAIFDTNNNLYLGNANINGIAPSPNAFTIQGTGSSTASVDGAALSISGGKGSLSGVGSGGGSLTLRGGVAGGSGDNNGGNVVIAGGTGVHNGLQGSVSIQGSSIGLIGPTTISATNASTSGSSNINGLQVNLLGTDTSGANTSSAINLSSVAPHTGNTYNGIVFGTGFTYLLQSADATLAADGGLTLGATNNTGSIDISNSADKSTFSITSAATLSSGSALIYANDTSGTDADILINLANNGMSKFSVDNTGNVLSGGTYNTNTFTKNNLTFGDTTGSASINGSSPAANGAGNGLTISGGAATGGAGAFSGGDLTLQGGAAAGTGDSNGGNVVLQGGAGVGSGVQGLVELAPTAFNASAEQDFGADGSITGVDTYSTIPVNATAAGLTITLPAPVQTTIGRILYVTAVAASNDFALEPAGGGAPVGISANGTATMIWNGTTWTNAGVNSGSVAGKFIQNQSTAAQTATFWINGIGRSDTAFITPSVTTADVTDGSGNSTNINLKSGDVTSGSGLSTGSVTISSGAGSGTDTSSGDVMIDVGAATGTGTTGNIKIGTGVSASSIQIGKVGMTTTSYGDITIGGSAGSGTTLTNNGATVNSTLSLPNFDYTGSGDAGSIGTAADTVDKYTSISIDQTQSPTQTLIVPVPTNSGNYGRIVYITNIGTQPFNMLGSVVNPGKTVTVIWSHTNGADSWTLAGVGGGSGDYILNQTTQQAGANFNISGTGVANNLQVTADTGSIDTASAGKLNIGLASGGNATEIDLNQDVVVAAGKNLTLSSGTGTITQNYISTTPGTATTINATNGASSGTTSVVGIGINLAGTDTSGTSNNYGINFGNVATHTGTTYTGLNFGAGYDYLFQSADANLSAAGGLSLGATNHNGSISVSNSFDGSTLSISSSATLSAANALVFVKDTSGVSSNKLISLENNSGSVFNIDAAGNVVETNSVTQTYTNDSGNGSANSITATNGSASGSNTVNGLNIGLLGTNTTGSNTNNAVNFADVTNPGNNVYNGLNFGTGYDKLINSANFTVTGTGVLQGISASLSGTNALTLGTAGPAGNTGAIVFQGSGGSGILTLQGPSIPNAGNYILSLPSISGNATVCTTDSICSTVANGNYLVQVPTNNTSGAAGANVIAPTSTTAAVVGLTVNGNIGAGQAAQAVIINQTQNATALEINNGGTSSGISLTQSTALGGNNAAIFINDTSATAANKLINLQANGNNKFTVTADGVVTLAGGQTGDIVTAGGITSTNLTIMSGSASAGASGDVIIDTGSSTSGTPTLSLGRTNAKAVAIGNTGASFNAESNGTANLFNGDTAHTINIGHGGSTTGQLVNIGSASSSSAVLLQGGSYSFNVTNTGVGINTGSPTADLSFASGATRTINILQAAAGSVGSDLQIQAGQGNGAFKGGDLILQGGAQGSSGGAGSVIVRANGTDSTTAFVVQRADGVTNVLAADTTNGQVVLGAANSLGGKLVFSDSGDNNAVTISAPVTASASYTIKLPQNTPSTGLCLATGQTDASQLVFTSCFQQVSNAQITHSNSWTFSGNNVVKVTVSPTGLGDLMVFSAGFQNNQTITSISGGGVSSWQPITSGHSGTGSLKSVEMWRGVTNAIGSNEITITYSNSPGTTDIAVDEYTMGNAYGSWSVDSSSVLYNSPSTNVTYPALAPQNSNEVYTGYAFVQNPPVTGGGTVGYNYESTGYGMVAYNTATASGINTQPAATQASSGNSYTIAATIIAFANNNVIINSPYVQNGNFWVQAATSGSVAGVLQAYNGGTGDILELKTGSGTTVGTVSSTGDVLFKHDSATAFQIQNSSNTDVLGVDTLATSVSINSTNSGNALIVSSSANPAASTNALIVANNTNASAAGNLIALQNSGANKFTVDVNGVVTVAGGQAADIKTPNATGATTNLSIASGNSTTSGNTGAVNLMSGNATAGSSGSLNIQSGSASGSGNTSGNVSIDAGSVSSSAVAGSINIGSANAAVVNLGGGSGVQTINVGNSSGNTGINIGTNSSAANTIQQGSTNAGTTVKLQGGANYLYVANAGVGIGTTTPKTTLDVAGAISTMYNGVRTYENVYSASGSVPATGTYELILPQNTVGVSLLTFTIKGYDYAANTGGWQVVAAGTVSNASTAWANTSAQITGKAPFTSVRFAYDNSIGRMVILFGTTTTVWQYAQVSLTQVTAGFQAQDIWGTGYTSNLLSAETNIVNISSPTVQKTVDYFTQGGNSFGTTAILGTNDNNSIQIRTNGTTRFTVDTSGNAELTNVFTSDVGIKTPALDGNSGALGVGTNTTTTALTLGRTGNTATNVYSGGAITITAGASSTWSTAAGDITVQAAGNLNLGTAGAGTVALGDSNATTINIGRGTDIARTINIGTAGSSTAQAVNIGSSNSGSSTTIKGGNNGVLIQSASTTAFRIQDTSNNNLLTADTSSNKRVVIGNSITPINTASGTGDVVVGGNLEVQGKIYFGNDANNSVYTSSGGGQLRFKGTARNSVTQTLVPEYPGAVMSPNGGSSNVGTMTSDFCSGSSRLNINVSGSNCGSTDEHNYYTWTTSQASASYDIFTRWQVPSNFDTTQANNFPTSLTFYGWHSTSSDTVTLTAYKNGTSCGTASIASGTTTAWATATITNTGNCNWAAGDIITFDVHLVSSTGNIARVGEINITYNTVF